MSGRATWPQTLFRLSQIPAVMHQLVDAVPSLGEGNATTRIHHRNCRGSRSLAACGAGTAVSNAGDRIYQLHSGRATSAYSEKGYAKPGSLRETTLKSNTAGLMAKTIGCRRSQES